METLVRTFVVLIRVAVLPTRIVVAGAAHGRVATLGLPVNRSGAADLALGTLDDSLGIALGLGVQLSNDPFRRCVVLAGCLAQLLFCGCLSGVTLDDSGSVLFDLGDEVNLAAARHTLDSERPSELTEGNGGHRAEFCGFDLGSHLGQLPN